MAWIRRPGDDPIVGDALDDCRNPQPGEPDATAPDVIERLDSCAEGSPSKTGFHASIEAGPMDGGTRRGWIERSDAARFLTVAGDPVAGTLDRIATRIRFCAGYA